MESLDMQFLLKEEVYNINYPQITVFFSSRDPFYKLSNMCKGMPIKIKCSKGKTYIFNSSEALYQACKYPPDLELMPKDLNTQIANVRERIIKSRSPMQSKITQKCATKYVRDDWEDIKIEVMLWALKLKAKQHTKFVRELNKANIVIVEKSRKDTFWGAKPEGGGYLRGKNVLGKLLMYVRDNIEEILSTRIDVNYLIGC